jgi:hypothetical protein
MATKGFSELGQLGQLAGAMGKQTPEGMVVDGAVRTLSPHISIFAMMPVFFIVIIFILIGLIARAASKDKTNGNLMIFIGILFGGGTFYVMSKKTPPPPSSS